MILYYTISERRVFAERPGIDFPVPIGTPVHAASSGMVILAGDSKGNEGTRVTMLHPNGNVTDFLHMSEVPVSTGDTVCAGQPIGLSGDTGKSTGPDWKIHPVSSLNK